MGKSFANFMCKKFFHPSSYANIKRVWMAEQRHDTEKKKQDTLRAEYERDQEIFDNRQLMGDVRVKHGLTFMYEPPKGLRQEEKEAGEQEYKFEWQRGAPREGYAKDLDIQDQPFGIAVRNVKCIRCHKWGHVNTDRECPLFDTSKDDEVAGPSTDRSDLMDDMRKDGLALKQNVLGRRVNEDAHNQKFVGSSDEEEDLEPEEAFLKSLSMKEKKKLLKKLEKMEKKQKRLDSKKSKKNKDKKVKERSRKASHPSDDSSTDSDGAGTRDRRKERNGGKKKRRDYSDLSNEDSYRAQKHGLGSRNHKMGKKIKRESERRKDDGKNRMKHESRRNETESSDDGGKKYSKDNKRWASYSLDGKGRVKRERLSRSRSSDSSRGHSDYRKVREEIKGHMEVRQSGYEDNRRRDRGDGSKYDGKYKSQKQRHEDRRGADKNEHTGNENYDRLGRNHDESRERHSRKQHGGDAEVRRGRHDEHESLKEASDRQRHMERDSKRRLEKKRRHTSSSQSSESDTSDSERYQKRRK